MHFFKTLKNDSKHARSPALCFNPKPPHAHLMTKFLPHFP